MVAQTYNPTRRMPSNVDLALSTEPFGKEESDLELVYWALSEYKNKLLGFAEKWATPDTCHLKTMQEHLLIIRRIGEMQDSLFTSLIETDEQPDSTGA